MTSEQARWMHRHAAKMRRYPRLRDAAEAHISLTAKLARLDYEHECEIDRGLAEDGALEPSPLALSLGRRMDMVRAAMHRQALIIADHYLYPPGDPRDPSYMEART